jgi:hypothetical protein
MNQVAIEKAKTEAEAKEIKRQTFEKVKGMKKKSFSQ